MRNKGNKQYIFLLFCFGGNLRNRYWHDIYHQIHYRSFFTSIKKIKTPYEASIFAIMMNENALQSFHLSDNIASKNLNTG